MNLLKYLFWFCWRIWFYLLIILPIVVLFPLLFLSILSEKTYHLFFKLARVWAKIIFYGMGFNLSIERDVILEQKNPYMIISNHTSMIDIMLMLIIIRKNPFVFVGKKELAKFPLFGFFYKKTCIMVDRKDSKSRFQVFQQAKMRLDKGLSICIFPEGGIPKDKNILLDKFKDGAFRLAVEHQIPIVPITIADVKSRFSYTFFSGSPGKIRVRLHTPIQTEHLKNDDKKKLKQQAYNTIFNQLKKFN